MKVDERYLNKWEKIVIDISNHCYVPRKVLLRVFAKSEIDRLESHAQNTISDVLDHSYESSISLRRLNEAYIWSNLLEQLDFSKFRNIAELCSGNSVTIDLALAYLQYKNNLYKVDYNAWEDIGQRSIGKKFRSKSLDIDVLKESEKIPRCDLIVMNHGIDDLFIGQWAREHNVNYYALFDAKLSLNSTASSSRRCWSAAMKDKKKYSQSILDLFSKLSQRIMSGSYIIIREYPSSFGIKHKFLERIHFVRELTEHIAEILRNNGYEQIFTNGGNLPYRDDFAATFFILKKP